jgi:hypothetical protein
MYKAEVPFDAPALRSTPAAAGKGMKHLESFA